MVSPTCLGSARIVFFFNNLFTYLFLTVLGLRCYVGFSLVVLSASYSLVAVHRLLIAVPSLVAKHRL